MGTAREIKRLSSFTGDARLYELSEPIKYDDAETTYIIVSAAVAPFTGAETYIFPADEAGKVEDWGELDGSYRGGLDHAKALQDAGFAITEPSA